MVYKTHINVSGTSCVHISGPSCTTLIASNDGYGNLLRVVQKSVVSLWLVTIYSSFEKVDGIYSPCMGHSPTDNLISDLFLGRWKCRLNVCAFCIFRCCTLWFLMKIYKILLTCPSNILNLAWRVDFLNISQIFLIASYQISN